MGALPPSTSPLTATETFRPDREKVTESPPTPWPAKAAKTSPPDCGRPCTLLNGPAFYKAAMSPYNYVSLLKNIGNFGGVGTNGQATLNSLYGKPLYHQLSRNLYMSVKFTF